MKNGKHRCLLLPSRRTGCRISHQMHDAPLPSSVWKDLFNSSVQTLVSNGCVADNTIEAEQPVTAIGACSYGCHRRVKRYMAFLVIFDISGIDPDAEIYDLQKSRVPAGWSPPQILDTRDAFMRSMPIYAATHSTFLVNTPPVTISKTATITAQSALDLGHDPSGIKSPP